VPVPDRRAERVPVHLACAALTLAVAAPLLGPGYVLAFDQVAVPRLALTWRAAGLSDTLPRAVPQDAVLALASLLVRGDLLQKALLVAILYAAAWGAASLVPTGRTAVRVVAAAGYLWTPYLAERLLIGHWGLLAAYAALPWVVRHARDARAGRPGAVARTVLCAAPACLTPTGSLLALALVAAVAGWPGPPGAAAGPGRSRRRTAAAAAVAVAALTLPWVVAGVLARPGGGSDPAGVDVFASRAESWAGTLGTVLGTGGLWNAGAVPATRASALAPLTTLAVLALAAAGLPLLRRRWATSGGTTPLLVLAAGGLVLALAGSVPVVRDGLRLLVEAVPGGGLLLDGHTFLAPYALLLAVGAALGAERSAERLRERLGERLGERLTARAAAGHPPERSPVRSPVRLAALPAVVLAAAVLLPLAGLPDLAWGGGGRLRPVAYPPDWDTVAERVAERPGELVTLPYGAVRAYAWARGPVLDPADRYLPVPVVVDDTLLVGTEEGTVTVRGESRRAAEVRACLDTGCPLASLGLRWVLVERGVPGTVPPQALEGLRLVHDGEDLVLYENPDGRAPAPPPLGDRALLAGAYAVAAGVLLAAAAALAAPAVTRARRRRRRADPRSSPAAVPAGTGDGGGRP